MNIRNVAILAAGKGKRLHETYGTNSSKAMTRIDDRYLVQDVVDCVNELESVENLYVVYGKGDDEIRQISTLTNKNVNYIVDDRQLGSLYSFSLLKDSIGAEPFILFDCDIKLDKKDFLCMMKEQKNQQNESNLKMLTVNKPFSFQTPNIIINEAGRITDFQKSNVNCNAHGGYIYTFKNFPYALCNFLLERDITSFSTFLSMLCKNTQVGSMHIKKLMDIDSASDIQFYLKNFANDKDER